MSETTTPDDINNTLPSANAKLSELFVNVATSTVASGATVALVYDSDSFMQNIPAGLFLGMLIGHMATTRLANVKSFGQALFLGAALGTSAKLTHEQHLEIQDIRQNHVLVPIAKTSELELAKSHPGFASNAQEQFTRHVANYIRDARIACEADEEQAAKSGYNCAAPNLSPR